MTTKLHHNRWRHVGFLDIDTPWDDSPLDKEEIDHHSANTPFYSMGYAVIYDHNSDVTYTISGEEPFSFTEIMESIPRKP